MNRSDFRYASTRVYVSNQMKTCAFAQASTLLALDAKTSVFKEGDSLESCGAAAADRPSLRSAENLEGQRGGADRDRTDDLRLAKPALSQLSYSPVEHPKPRGAGAMNGGPR